MEMISADARVLRYLRWWRHSSVSCTTIATWEDDEDQSRVLDIGRLRLAGCSGAACGQISGGGDGAGGGGGGGGGVIVGAFPPCGKPGNAAASLAAAALLLRLAAALLSPCGRPACSNGNLELAAARVSSASGPSFQVH